MLTDDQKTMLRDAFANKALKVLSVSERGDPEWKAIERVHKSDVRPETIYELETEHGKSVVTGGHRVYVNPNPWDAVDAETLSVGDRVMGVVDNQLAFLRLRSVRRVQDRQWMFDITVADNHNLVFVSSRICTKNSPDRNYHFRPPAHEETVSQFSRVFGHIWEDVELQEYLARSLDMVSASPPRTPFSSIDQMVQYRPEWRTLLLTGAMMFAVQALRLNWIADEFSLIGETQIGVLVDGELIEATLEELYNLLKTSPLFEGRLKVCAVQGRQVCEATVSKVLRHHTPHKAIYAISTRLGVVQVTGDHSLFLFNHGTPVPARADQLKVGDLLAGVVDGSIVGEPVQSVVVLPAVEWTYDLSVPGPENFVLRNGLLAHNSYSIGGVSLDLEKSSKYEGMFSSLSDQFDKQLEKSKATINVIKGLQQPRYGTGLRSAFGPHLSRSILSPQKFIGF